MEDKASQAYIKPVARRGPPAESKPAEERGCETQPEPEGEPQENEPADMDTEEAPVHEQEWVPELPVPAAPQPAMEQYERKWAAKKARHARPVPGDFGSDNLAPLPEPQLWQAENTLPPPGIICFCPALGMAWGLAGLSGGRAGFHDLNTHPSFEET